jgi:glutamate carboxypeptidase
MRDDSILNYLRARREVMIDELKRLIEHESPSRDNTAIGSLGHLLAGRLAGLGGEVQIVDDAGGGIHIVGRFSSAAENPPALILGHYDTVWPIGTIERMPVRQEAGRLYGPGALDMKASLVMLLEVLEAFRELGIKPPRPIVVLFTSDEEMGSPGSRPLIERLARESGLALVLEPPLADGGLKTARKGVGRFTVEVEGKAAHAGVAPEQGASAVLELAHQIVRIHGLNMHEEGTSVNVGVVQGGTAANVVPALAVAQVDVRATTSSAAAETEQALFRLQPVLSGTRIRVNGAFNRPPMERTAQGAALFARARNIAVALGLDLSEGSTGGGSDGNFTSALGVPTLDGLGARGGGAHADVEHVVIESLPERAALLAALILNL